MPFDLSLSESAGSRSLDRLVMRPHGMRSRARTPGPRVHDYPRKWLRGDFSPTNQMCPNGSVKPPCRCVPQGAMWSLMSPPVAPASTERAITSSGSSTNKFHPHSRRTNLLRTVETVLYRLVQEEECAVNLQASD